MTESRLDTLRCADQDRELVAQVLNTAYSDGRLTFDEHADRIAKAYDAKTFGELSKLTTDLIPDDLPAAPQPQPLLPAAPTVGAYRGGNAMLSTLRSGRLTLVDSEVTLNAWLGEARLDLVGAQFVAPETIINMGGMMCDFKIRVPEGVTVDTSSLSLILADAKISGIVPGSILLRLVGTVLMGDVKVYGPALANPHKYARFAQ